MAIRATDETDHDLLSSGQDLHLDLPEHPVRAHGDALSLVEAVKNLLGNAVRYGAAPIWCAVEHNPGDGTARLGDCSLRVLRGASWNNFPHTLRSARRDMEPPGNRLNSIGFRVARTLTPGR